MMGDFDLESESVGPGIWLMRLSGKVSALHTPGLRAEVERLMESGYKTFIFDFSAVTDIDSTGIGAFLAVAKVLSNVQGSARIFGTTTHIKKVLELAHLTRYIDVFPSQEDAIANRNVLTAAL